MRQSHPSRVVAQCLALQLVGEWRIDTRQDDDWRRNRKKIMKSRESGSQMGEEVLENGGFSLFLDFRFESFADFFWVFSLLQSFGS
jgi:hypothetical protein